MKQLYLDCFSGISGDMTIGALLDLGADFPYLEKELKKLHIDDEYTLSAVKVVKNGITSTKFDVKLHHEHHEHTHGEHVHNDEHHEHNHSDHVHTHNHHSHGHHHAHSHGDKHHHHRSYKHIVKMINDSTLTDQVKATALQIFERIGVAEGKIHGVSLENVHFHEVGAVDSIIDIVGTAILIDQLEIEKVVASPIPVGAGSIHIDHGIYPVPAPATLEILRGIPIRESDIQAELTTPTGAAIIAALATEYKTMPSMQVESIGYGAGTKTFPNHPNVLRTVIGNV